MRKVNFQINFDAHNKATLISRTCNVGRVCEGCRWEKDCDRLMQLIKDNVDKAEPTFRCNYCWRVLPKSEFKEIAVRAGRDEWQYKGQVCRECRNYLRGIWKEVKNEAKSMSPKV